MFVPLTEGLYNSSNELHPVRRLRIGDEVWWYYLEFVQVLKGTPIVNKRTLMVTKNCKL